MISFIIAISLFVVFAVLVVNEGRPAPANAAFGLSPLFVILAWLAFFSGSMSISKRRKEVRPWLTVGEGKPAWALFLIGTGWLAGTALVYSIQGDLKFTMWAAGIAIVYWCIAYPSPLSLVRASSCGIGLLVAAIGLLL